MVAVVEGDLLQDLSPWGVLLHQVNCLGIAGAGVAKRVREAFSGWYEAYREHCDAAGDRKNLLGTTHSFRARPDLVVCSAFCQYDISKARRATDYDAWNSVFMKLAPEMEAENARGMNWEIRAPYGIGCGLGGGDWGVMSDMINYFFENSKTRFVLYRLPEAKPRSEAGRDLMEGGRPA